MWTKVAVVIKRFQNDLLINEWFVENLEIMAIIIILVLLVS